MRHTSHIPGASFFFFVWERKPVTKRVNIVVIARHSECCHSHCYPDPGILSIHSNPVVITASCSLRQHNAHQVTPVALVWLLPKNKKEQLELQKSSETSVVWGKIFLYVTFGSILFTVVESIWELVDNV